MMRQEITYELCSEHLYKEIGTAMQSGWTEWQVIYDDYWTREFSHLARKRIPYSNEVAEEAMQEARQELAIKLDKLDTAPNDLKKYLRGAFRNTLEDYLRAKEGYPRPPSWVKKLGAAYERIHKLLCLESRSVNDIHSIMSNLYQYTRDFVEQVISEIRAGVVNCGSWRDAVPIDLAINEVEQMDNQNYVSYTPEEILQDMDSIAVVDMILNNPASDLGRSENMSKALQILAQCQLSDDERLLLRLFYTDGYTVSKAARLLKLSDAEARKIFKSIHKRLQKSLADAGIMNI